MKKKYIVRLTNEERRKCEEVVDTLKGTSQKVKRANILLKADADGPGWTDQQIADAFRCRRQTVENVRQKCDRKPEALIGSRHYAIDSGNSRKNR